MALSKRGVWRGVLVNLILLLLIVGLVLAMIFREVLTQEDTDWETCRQSVYARANIPEVSDLASFKSDFPLRCENQVIEISKSQVESGEATRVIADTIVQCWALFGNGDFQLFPSQIFPSQTFCIPCARIHLTDEAREYMLKEKKSIPIATALENPKATIEGLTYKAYLNDFGSQYSAFNPGFGREFDLRGDVFKVDTADVLKDGEVRNKKGFVDDGRTFLFFSGINFRKVYLPEYFYPDRGDLLIVFGSSTASRDLLGYIPFLFYFQMNQNPNPFEEAKEVFMDGSFWQNQEVCTNWEGIPA